MEEDSTCDSISLPDTINIMSSDDKRSLEESLVASALLDLAAAPPQPLDMKPNNKTKIVNLKGTPSIPSHVLMKADGSLAGTLLAVKNNLLGQKVIQLHNGIELVLADQTAKPNGSSVIVPNPNPSRFALLRQDKKTEDAMDGDRNNNQRQTVVMIPGNRFVDNSSSVYQLVSGPSNGFQTSALSSAANGINTSMKKRGRKKLCLPDHCSLSDEGGSGGNESSSSSTHSHHHQGRSNPIKEFRQRQRTRERMEDERLFSLEQRYLRAKLPDLPESIEELYESRGLNIKFPRVKTLFKRGKASDDFERSNRKKECARRDSKNYRERAKAKRDLVVKKIQFMEDLLNRTTMAKYQFVFK